jgi:hypothetical protein
MEHSTPMGRLLIYTGIGLVAAGILFNLGLGRLPGDIHIRTRNTSFYFPVVTCLALSAVLSLIVWLCNRR